MPRSGKWSFADPDDFHVRLHRAHVDLLVTDRAAFSAHLTWASLDNLYVLRADEELSRIAFVTLPPAWIFVALAARDWSSVLWNGVELLASDILVHGRGERFHQRTTGPCSWTLLAAAPEYLDKYAAALLGKRLLPTTIGGLLRPAKRDMARLRRLCREACRIAETKPTAIAHPQVARGVEQSLTHALITCLAADEAPAPSPTRANQVRVMARFEEMLADRLDQPSHLRELCMKLGVTERTLRAYCHDFLGLSPGRYLRLRRLRAARMALRNADPKMSSVAVIARDCGFTELGRFAASYRAAFGETPSATLRRASVPRIHNAFFSEFA